MRNSLAFDGPDGNGGAEQARIADRLAAEDEARSAWLEEAVKRSGWSKAERRAAPGCPECGSKAKHFRGCTQAKQTACRCGHDASKHRGIVCHGWTTDGKRCRCTGCVR